ncbi:MAG: helix-turn-helix transcriptional regulator [Calditrichae bacterium]|nr:helix-turn-helix transcriptional regulator [Calditrichia bacterium]
MLQFTAIIYRKTGQPGRKKYPVLFGKHAESALPDSATKEYSRIENNKTDPALSSLVKIAKALGVSVADLFTADDVFKDVNSVDKSLMEKISLIDGLDKKEKTAFFTMLDALVAKKKLKDNLSNVLQLAQ